MLSIFLSKRNAFLGLFFGTRLDDLLDFAPKIRNFLLQARKKTYKTKKFKKKIFYLQNVPLVVLTSGLETLTII